MADLKKLDYERHRNRIPVVTLPPDWRRRMGWAIASAALVFALTLEAARRSQSPGLLENASGRAPVWIGLLQRELDGFVASSGSVPHRLSDVPGITKLSAAHRTDRWGRSYQLTSISGKPTVISYGRDGSPGGRGLDVDITASTTFRDDPLPWRDFVRLTRLVPLLILCTIAAMATGFMTFLPNRENSRAPLPMMLAAALLTGAAAVFVGGIMAVLHVPSGH